MHDLTSKGINLSPSTMNKRKSVLQALLTCICLIKGCVISMLMINISVLGKALSIIKIE